MVHKPVQHVLDWLRHKTTLGQAADADLLAAYLGHASEAAFAELVRRHGPMVWGVCQRLAPNRQDAEDCFQATFLVLLRKGASVRPCSRLGAWLHGVAYHTALKVRTRSARRGHWEQQMEHLPEPKPRYEPDAELLEQLDRELNALPEKYRLAIVLCELEGQGIKEAAQALSCPVGTLAARLSRGRDLLARRLGRRLGATALTALLAQRAGAAPPLAPVTPAVASLAQAAMRSLFLVKLQAALVVAAALLVTGVLGGWFLHLHARPVHAPTPDALTTTPEPETTAWGKPVDGVQYGLELWRQPQAYHVGDKVTFVLKARNITDKAVTFEQVGITTVQSAAPRQDGASIPTVLDAAGRPVKAYAHALKGAAPGAEIRTIRLGARETTVLGHAIYSLGHARAPTIEVGPGTYHVRFDTVCWLKGHQRPTGTLTMKIVDPVAWGKTTDGVDYGLAFKERRNTYRVGEKVTVVVKARNVSDKFVPFHQVGIVSVSSNVDKAIGDGVPKVRDARGKDVPSWPTYLLGKTPTAPVQQIELWPRQVAVLGEIALTIGPSRDVAGFDAGPGEYRLRYDSACWLPGHRRPTGELALTVVDPTAWGKAVEGVEYGFHTAELRETYQVGEQVTFVVVARNVSGQPVQFDQVEIAGVTTSARGVIAAVVPRVRDADGKEIAARPAAVGGLAAPAKIEPVRLGIGETRVLGRVAYHLGANVPGIDVGPGEYRVHFDTVCWLPGHRRPTGSLKLAVTDPVAWGKSVEGVQYGLEIKEAGGIYRRGDRLTFVLKARNPTRTEIALKQVAITGVGSLAEGVIGAAVPTVTDANGKQIEAWPVHLPGPPVEGKVLSVTLPPRTTKVLGEVTYSLSEGFNVPIIKVGPGVYSIRFETVCWLRGHQRPTGSVDILVE